MTQRKVSKITTIVSSKNMEGFNKQLVNKLMIKRNKKCGNNLSKFC